MTQPLLSFDLQPPVQPRPRANPVRDELVRLSANAARVLELLSDGLWHTNMELVAVGGIRAVGRCWDLQRAGHVIAKEHVHGGSWRYKLQKVS